MFGWGRKNPVKDPAAIKEMVKTLDQITRDQINATKELLFAIDQFKDIQEEQAATFIKLCEGLRAGQDGISRTLVQQANINNTISASNKTLQEYFEKLSTMLETLNGTISNAHDYSDTLGEIKKEVTIGLRDIAEKINVIPQTNDTLKRAILDSVKGQSMPITEALEKHFNRLSGSMEGMKTQFKDIGEGLALQRNLQFKASKFAQEKAPFNTRRASGAGQASNISPVPIEGLRKIPDELKGLSPMERALKLRQWREQQAEQKALQELQANKEAL